MAISAVSSISSGGLSGSNRSPLGAIAPLGKAGPIPRVQSIPSLQRREDGSEAAEAAEAAGPAVSTAGTPGSSRNLALDPRSAATLVRERLDDLLGQKAAIERRQAQQQGERSAAVISELAQLKSRDAAVRAHEAAHMAAGGRYVTGGASYTYQQGPDGAEYAVGGEVGIDTSPVPGDPQATAEKMRTVRAAALAPSDPSAADLSVAASAAQVEAEAMAEIAQEHADAASNAGAAGAAAYSATGHRDDVGAGGRDGSSAPREPLNVLA